MKKLTTPHAPVLASALAAALLLLSATTAAAQGTAATPSTATSGAMAASGSKAGKSAAADHKFAEKAALGGMAEVELSQLAQQKASSDEVKQFAQRMVQDHGKANDELKQIASSKGIDLPAAPDKKHMKAKDKLDKLSGADFDRAYMKDMLADHKKAVSDFKSEAKSGKDADLKAFAAKTLPTLEDHLKMAQSLEKTTQDAKKTAGKS